MNNHPLGQKNKQTNRQTSRGYQTDFKIDPTRNYDSANHKGINPLRGTGS